MSMQENRSKPRFIKPPNLLKQKVGNGGISEKLLDESQTFINTVEFDFIPYAQTNLKQISQITKAASSNDNFEEFKDRIIPPVLELKANGGMFRYQLVSEVADIALQFLDSIHEINKDGLAVLKAHENTLQVIIKNKLEGDGGKEGYALVKELDKACKRYFSKHSTG